MTPVKSSQIEAIGWDADELHIKFLRGATYAYQNVHHKTYLELLNAKSVGATFAAKIKPFPDRFPFKKLGENGAGTVQSTEELATITPLSLSGDGWKIIATPEAEKQKKQLLLHSAKIKVVDSDSSTEVARHSLKNLASFRQVLEKTRKEVKEPVLELGRKIDERAREFGAEVLGEESRVSGLISDYAREMEMRRRQAEEDAKRLADEAERKEREAEEARIAAEQLEMQRFQEMEDGKRKAAEKLRLEALRATQAAEAAERAEEEARKKAMAASMAAMAAPVQGTKAQLDYEIEDIARLYSAAPQLVTLTPKRRELLEFINLQRERGLPVGLPGIKVVENFKTSSRG